MKKAFSLFATMFLVALAAQAQLGSTVGSGVFSPTPTPPAAEEFKLEATRAGLELDASGYVSISRLFNGSISVAVRANASLPDGTIVVVSVIDLNNQETDVGPIEIRLGSGLLSLNSNKEPESAAFPIEEVTSFRVSYDGEVLLIGKR